LEKAAVTLSREAGILSTVVSMVIVDAEGPRVEGRATQLDIPVLLPAGYGGGFYAAEECRSMSMPSSPAPMMSQKLMDVAFEVQSSAVHKEYKKSAAMPRRSASGPRAKAFAEDSAGSGLYDLLALQLPGGGFGPMKEVLALLGLPKAPTFPLKGAEAERCALAALALAWLANRHAGESATWEGLVEKSRKLVEDFAAGQPAGSALADPMAWAKAMIAGLKA
jgi:hypothetical protein